MSSVSFIQVLLVLLAKVEVLAELLDGGPVEEVDNVTTLGPGLTRNADLQSHADVDFALSQALPGHFGLVSLLSRGLLRLFRLGLTIRVTVRVKWIDQQSRMRKFTIYSGFHKVTIRMRISLC